MAKNFHKNPFDEGTQVKLELFRNYTNEWLPVWLSRVNRTTNILIADFFAGPGQDMEGRPGSPLIFLEILRKYANLIQEKQASIELFFNEFDTGKAKILRELLESEQIPVELCTYTVLQLEFEKAFEEKIKDMKSGPNLLILDQQGMSQISEPVFTRIVSFPRTDFIFFISSSTIRRFETHPAFQKYLKIPEGSITGGRFNDTHRNVTQFYKDLAQKKGSNIFIGSFSIKKGSNIYGLIFGSGHPLGLEKFLKVCWGVDPERGEANFDIDEDGINPNAPFLFSDLEVPKKLDAFKKRTKEKLLKSELQSDKEVYLYTLQEGFLPKHGRAVLRELIKTKKVLVLGGEQARVSKEGFKNPRFLELNKNG